MNSPCLLYLVILGIIFIVFIILLYVCMTNENLYPGFSVFRDTISEVQDTSMGSSKYINSGFALVGLGLLPFPYFFLSVLPSIRLSYAGVICLYLNPIGLIVLAIWPNFTNNMHYVGAGLAMGGTLLAMLLFISPIINSSVIPIVFKVLLTLNIFFSILICIPLVYSNIANGPRSKLLYNPNIWEWIEFFSILTFIFMIYLMFWYLLFI
ncbi:MAG: DUF998 domain-containing protein [Promethearchaeota archaeon]